MIMMYRLLLNLGEASDKDIYIGSHYSTSTGGGADPSTFSSLEVDHHNGAADQERGTLLLGMCNYHLYIIC